MISLRYLKFLSGNGLNQFKDTVCTSDILQTGFGDRDGDFNFNSFLFNEDSNLLDIVCRIKFCLKSENCFEQDDTQCGENYSKNK